MRDWRSGIVTITVRDQRHRQHDPILGVVPLKLPEILQTSSQVTRWYPLDGGIVSRILPLSRAQMHIDPYRVSDVLESLYFSEVLKQDYHQTCWVGTLVHSNSLLIVSWP